MSRKRKAPKKIPIIDPKYKSSVIPKLINSIMYDRKKTTAEKIGFFMTIQLIIIVLFSVWGCGMTCYHLGRKAGIEDAVQHLIDEGRIDVTPD